MGGTWSCRGGATVCPLCKMFRSLIHLYFSSILFRYWYVLDDGFRLWLGPYCNIIYTLLCTELRFQYIDYHIPTWYQTYIDPYILLLPQNPKLYRSLFFILFVDQELSTISVCRPRVVDGCFVSLSTTCVVDRFALLVFYTLLLDPSKPTLLVCRHREVEDRF